MNLVSKFFNYLGIKDPFVTKSPTINLLDDDMFVLNGPSTQLLNDVREQTYRQINSSYSLKVKANRAGYVITTFMCSYKLPIYSSHSTTPLNGREMAIGFQYKEGILYSMYDEADIKSLNRQYKLDQILN